MEDSLRPELWSSEMTLMLFSPDAVEADLVAPILKELADQEGVYLVRLKYLDLSLYQLERLYGHQLYRMTPNWWIVQELFSMGRSLAVILAGNRKGDLSLAERVTHLKGRANPAICPQEKLRRKFEAENRLVNLIHSSDNPEEFCREVEIFFSKCEIEQAYRLWKSQLLSIKPELLQEHVNGVRLLGFFETVSRLKCRFAALLLQDSPDALSRGLLESLLNERRYIASNKQRVERSGRILEMLGKQREYVADLSVAGERLERAMASLIELPYSMDGSFVYEYDQLNVRYGPIVTKWERLTIVSGIAVPSSIHFNCEE